MAFGISSDRLSLSPAEILAERRLRRQMELDAQERKDEINASLFANRPTIGVGAAYNRKGKQEAAEKLAEAREKQAETIRKRQEKLEDEKRELENWKEKERFKAELEGKKTKEPTMTDYKIQDAVEAIDAGDFDDFEDEAAAITAFREQYNVPVSHPKIREAFSKRTIAAPEPISQTPIQPLDDLGVGAGLPGIAPVGKIGISSGGGGTVPAPVQTQRMGEPVLPVKKGNTATIRRNGMLLLYDFDKGTVKRIG